jgi:8-oxo-dGTP pyrophosphatase MutT (NUDIX family)
MHDAKNLRKIFAKHPARLIDEGQKRRAAVAAILHQRDSDTEILFIERAHRIGDPWSGDLGFPGGRCEPLDRSPRHTAERETLEEIGIDLTRHEYLGQLDDISGAHAPIIVSCFVYMTSQRPAPSINHEVTTTFWVSLDDLCDDRRHGEFPVRFREIDLVRPAIELPLIRGPVLWGITYRLVISLLNRLGCAPPIRSNDDSTNQPAPPE